MESLDMEHGLRGMLLSIIGLLGAMVLSHVVKGIWVYFRRNKVPSREQFRQLTEALSKNTAVMESQRLMIDKIARDIRRIYLFLKVISGEKWKKFYAKVEEIEKDQNLN